MACYFFRPRPGFRSRGSQTPVEVMTQTPPFNGSASSDTHSHPITATVLRGDTSNSIIARNSSGEDTDMTAAPGATSLAALAPDSGQNSMNIVFVSDGPPPHFTSTALTASPNVTHYRSLAVTLPSSTTADSSRRSSTTSLSNLNASNNNASDVGSVASASTATMTARRQPTTTSATQNQRQSTTTVQSRRHLNNAIARSLRSRLSNENENELDAGEDAMDVEG